MEVCVFSLLIFLCVGLYGKSTYAGACTDLVVTPASLLVEYGSTAQVNCSIPSKPETVYMLGWESKTSQLVTRSETSIVWKVESLMNWEEPDGLYCYLTVTPDQCETKVNLTIYKKPDWVKLSSVPDEWVERNETELKCEIKNIGPGHSISVRWSRTHSKQNNTFIQFNETLLANEQKNVSETVNVIVTPSREDDGVQYQCAAVLNLEQHGQTLLFPSQALNITVHYKPMISQSDNEIVSVTGESLVITCSADGNPSPHYTWTFPNNTLINSSSINIISVHKEDQGQYICTATNDLGQATRNVTLTVKPTDKTILIVIVAVAVVVVMALLALVIVRYRRTHMGQYILKHLRSHSHKGHVDLNAEDQGQL